MSSLPDFTVCGTLGKACSGLSEVLLVKQLADESLAALRILPTEKMDYEKIKEEVWFLKWLSHPCIISVNQIISVGSDVYVFSTFCDLCSVLQVVHNHYPCGLPEKAIAQILKNVLLAVQSIRCSHILLHSTGIVKLTGFRHCIFLQHNELTGADNVLHNFDAEISDEVLWLAPEILRQSKYLILSGHARSVQKNFLQIVKCAAHFKDLYGYGLSSDVYSIGITICEMANGFPPFSDMDRLQMLFEKSKGTTPRLLDCTTLPDKEDMERDQQSRQRRRFSDSLHVITDNCLKPLPENRWSVSKLLTHSFVKSIRKNRSFSSLLPDIT